MAVRRLKPPSPQPSKAFKPADNVVALMPALRRQRIVEFLRQHGAVTLNQLEEALAASVSTLRRDLDALAAEGLLDRTHGGALLRQQGYTTFEPDARAALDLSPREKSAIGKAAAQGLEAHQSVIFDSGSTVLEAARAAVARQIPLTAITNDVAIAQVLGASALVQVHVLGGALRTGTTTLTGESMALGAGLWHADVLLCGAHAITHGVVSETSTDVAAAKRALLQAADAKRLLVDSSKFRPRTLMQVAPLTAFDELITDRGADAQTIKALRKLGLRVQLVG